MNDTIAKLATYLSSKPSKLRVHFYRNRHLLNESCKNIQIQNLIHNESDLNLLQQQCLYGPLTVDDCTTPIERSALRRWKSKLPQDPKFFRLFATQLKIWKQFEDKTLLEFLDSPEGRAWYRGRKKLKRAPLFELDCHYKVSKSSALRHECRIRELLRKQPLLRWEDLRDLGVKNAQSIFQRFPQRALHRSRYLKNLRAQTDSE